MTEQQIFNFNFNPSYSKQNLIEDISNKDVLNFLKKFPGWDNKLVNLFGDRKSGKTFILKIFNSKNNFLYINNSIDFNKNFDNFFSVDRLILDDIEVEEKKLFSLLNNFILHKKFMIISSKLPLTNLNFKLNDLNSRLKEFYLIEIKNPSDKLIYSLVLKYFSDNQVVIKKTLIDHIVKKIDRSYPRISDFLAQLNNSSIIKKKKIDYKLINDVLNELI